MVGDQVNTVVSSANLMMVLESCLATVVGEQGVQEGTEHTPLRGTCVAYPYQLGAAHQKV